MVQRRSAPAAGVLGADCLRGRRRRAGGENGAGSCLGTVMRHHDRTAELEIARIADVQHGVVARRQLFDAGVTRTEIRERLASGALLLEFRGVYRVGHRAPNTDAGYMAAVLACGDGALLSGQAASYHFRLVRGLAPPPHVTTATERRIEGITTSPINNFLFIRCG